MIGWILIIMFVHNGTSFASTATFANQVSCEAAGQQFLRAFKNPSSDGAYYVCAPQYIGESK
jgi:hypothetical protein